MDGNMCDTCANFVYDEEEDWEYCAVDMDEDDYVRLVLPERGRVRGGPPPDVKNAEDIAKIDI